MSSKSEFCNMKEHICSYVAKYVIYGYSLQQSILYIVYNITWRKSYTFYKK